MSKSLKEAVALCSSCKHVCSDEREYEQILQFLIKIRKSFEEETKGFTTNMTEKPGNYYWKFIIMEKDREIENLKRKLQDVEGKLVAVIDEKKRAIKEKAGKEKSKVKKDRKQGEDAVAEFYAKGREMKNVSALTDHRGSFSEKVPARRTSGSKTGLKMKTMEEIQQVRERDKKEREMRKKGESLLRRGSSDHLRRGKQNKEEGEGVDGNCGDEGKDGTPLRSVYLLNEDSGDTIELVAKSQESPKPPEGMVVRSIYTFQQDETPIVMNKEVPKSAREEGEEDGLREKDLMNQSMCEDEMMASLASPAREFPHRSELEEERKDATLTRDNDTSSSSQEGSEPLSNSDRFSPAFLREVEEIREEGPTQSPIFARLNSPLLQSPMNERTENSFLLRQRRHHEEMTANLRSLTESYGHASPPPPIAPNTNTTINENSNSTEDNWKPMYISGDKNFPDKVEKSSGDNYDPAMEPGLKEGWNDAFQKHALLLHLPHTIPLSYTHLLQF